MFEAFQRSLNVLFKNGGATAAATVDLLTRSVLILESAVGNVFPFGRPLKTNVSCLCIKWTVGANRVARCCPEWHCFCVCVLGGGGECTAAMSRV